MTKTNNFQKPYMYSKKREKTLLETLTFLFGIVASGLPPPSWKLFLGIWQLPSNIYRVMGYRLSSYFQEKTSANGELKTRPSRFLLQYFNTIVHCWCNKNLLKLRPFEFLPKRRHECAYNEIPTILLTNDSKL